jgi:hypothetical protein
MATVRREIENRFKLGSNTQCAEACAVPGLWGFGKCLDTAKVVILGDNYLELEPPPSLTVSLFFIKASTVQLLFLVLFLFLFFFQPSLSGSC